MVMSTLNKESICLSSQYIYFLFPFLIAISRASSMILKRGGQKRHHFFVPDLSWKVSSVSLLSSGVNCRVSVDTFYQVKKVSSIFNLVRDVIISDYWILSNPYFNDIIVYVCVF